MEQTKGQFVIAIRVENRFGVLSRVAGMFSRRGFNIDSLTVSETETNGVSRITISMQGDHYQRCQIIKQLSKLSEVMQIKVMEPAESVIREMLLIKVKSTPESRRDVMDATTVYRASIVDYSPSAMCVAVSGDPAKLNAFVELMKPYGILEICRTGVVAMDRDAVSLRDTDMHYLNDLQ